MKQSELEGFIDELSRQGVVFYAKGETIWASAPKGVINDSIKNELKERKKEILSILKERGLVVM